MTYVISDMLEEYKSGISLRSSGSCYLTVPGDRNRSGEAVFFFSFYPALRWKCANILKFSPTLVALKLDLFKPLFKP